MNVLLLFDGKKSLETALVQFVVGARSSTDSQFNGARARIETFATA
jgi:hypothetical protein